MKSYFYHIKLFFYRFSLILLFFSVSRFLFYLFNVSYFDSVHLSELLKISLFGIRFDVSALFYFNLIFIILSLIPGDFKNCKNYQTLLVILFMIVNSFLLATNYIDTKFFDFEHKRLTADLFSSVWLGEDFITLLPDFLKDYWYLFMIWVVMCYGIYKLYPKLNRTKISSDKINLWGVLKQSGIFILIMSIGVVAGRGGFQLKPLRVIHAADCTSAKNIPLVLNTPFTIMKTIGAKSIKAHTYFTDEKLDSIYSPIHQYKQTRTAKTNVVIIILESFSKEYIGALNNVSGYTPFLDSLINNSLVFTNAFANGKRSIEALPSIMAGLPALTDETYISSRFSSNKINSIATELAKEGYYTAFFHGGKNGTMGFDTFVKIAGFENYFGLNEYPSKKDYDGNWGIYDEEYLQYFSQQMSRFKEPFFTSVFTLTSHHPYEIPEKYQGKFPKGTLKIHESIGYTDYSLSKFFESAKKTEWYKNTLFIITADHTAQAKSDFYKTQLGNYAIPIILFNPTDTLLKGMSNIIAQQADLFPTIMDFLGYNKAFVTFGNSLLTNTNDPFSVNYINGIFQLIMNDYLLQFDGSKSVAFFNVKTDRLLKHNLLSETNDYIKYEEFLKAIIQSYQSRLINNQLTIN